MSQVYELFWDASVEDIKKGYVYADDDEAFVCLICGAAFTKGVVYAHGDGFYEAERFVKIHINQEHTSMFHYLMNMDKKLTGITEHQKNLLNYFYEGLSDNDLVKELGVSSSTIRNHRFNLREKAKQAKVFLAIMECLENKTNEPRFINIPRTAVMVDDRFAITEEENQKFLEKYFPDGLDGPLSHFPLKEKRKVAILKHLTKRFELNKKYTEKEVNAVLKGAYHDYVLLRRYLIEYGFMDRNRDGSSYWLKV